MTRWFHSLMWISCLVVLATGVPLDRDTSATDERSLVSRNAVGTPISAEGSDSFIEQSQYTESVQLIYSQNEQENFWSVYKGPQGVPVNPCGNDRFELIYPARAPHDGLIEQPPYLAADVRWGFPVRDYKHCQIVGAVGSPGQLRCGDDMIVDFQKDAGYNKPTVLCSDDTWYHRGWFAEF